MVSKIPARKSIIKKSAVNFGIPNIRRSVTIKGRENKRVSKKNKTGLIPLISFLAISIAIEVHIAKKREYANHITK